ncbi:hypothetical protein D3C75_527400 [compost metagenome]
MAVDIVSHPGDQLLLLAFFVGFACSGAEALEQAGAEELLHLLEGPLFGQLQNPLLHRRFRQSPPVLLVSRVPQTAGQAGEISEHLLGHQGIIVPDQLHQLSEALLGGLGPAGLQMQQNIRLIRLQLIRLRRVGGVQFIAQDHLVMPVNKAVGKRLHSFRIGVA